MGKRSFLMRLLCGLLLLVRCAFGDDFVLIVDQIIQRSDSKSEICNIYMVSPK